MAEFTINSSINATTCYAPFELNYGYMLRSGQHVSTNTMFKGVKQIAQQALWDLINIHDAILEHRVMQMHYSNKHRKLVSYTTKMTWYTYQPKTWHYPEDGQEN